MACKPQVSMQPLSVAFGELDDPDWVSLYPDERGGCSTISPVQSPRKVDGSSEIQAYLGSSSMSAPFVEVFTKKFPKDEVLAIVEKSEGKLSMPLQASYERRKRLRKRKSFIVSDDNEEVKKQETLRQRKKAYVGELEKKVGTMTSAIAELNSTINMISTENVNVRNQLAYLYHAPGTSINSGSFISPNRMPALSSFACSGAAGAKPVRAKRSKLSKREKEGPLKELWKFRKAASVVLVAFLCIMMLFFPVRLGVQSLGNLLTGRTSMKWVEDGNNISHHAEWPAFMHGTPPVHSGTLQESIPRYVQGMEGSSNPGMGTGMARTGKVGCQEGTTSYLHISAPQNSTDPRNGTIGGNKFSKDLEEAKLMDANAGAVRQKKPGTSKAEGESGSMQQWGSSGTILSSGKCTEVFQYKIPSDAEGGIPVVNRMIRGNKHRKAQGGKTSLKLQKHEASSSMVVSILPRKSAARSGEIFVVVAIDGVKYVTYSCTLAQQILPASPS